MDNINARRDWSKQEELDLLKDISSNNHISTLTQKYGRSQNALELRLQKIIYNIIVNKNISNIELSRRLNMPVEIVDNYFTLYKKRLDKNTLSTNNMHGGNRIDNMITDIEKQNQLMKLLVENKKLYTQITKLIKSGQLDKSIINHLK